MADKKKIYQFQEKIQVILASNMRNVNDPRLAFATITAVKVSNDLKYAKVFWSSSKEKIEEVKKGFESAKGFLRHILSEALPCRAVPEIRFFFDESADNFYKMSELLEKARLKDSQSNN